MGRWAIMILQGKNNKKVFIITAYRVCRQSSLSGLLTKYNQEWSDLAKTQTNPDRRHQLNQDLRNENGEMIETGHKIIIVLDTNQCTNTQNSKT
jgi:hypothetical protein